MKASKALAGAWCKCKNKHPCGESNEKSRNFESRKLKSKTRGQRFHFPFSISAFYFLFSVFVLGLLDHGGWTRLVFRYQRSSLENQFEPTHVGCHLISALVLCVWRPGIGCSLLDVRCWMFVVGCSLLDVRCWMFVVGCSLLDVSALRFPLPARGP